MYGTKKLTGHIHYVGVNDRTSYKFEQLWSLNHGVSYNSYLILDEKVALIDTVEIGFADVFLEKIESLLDGRSIDYLVVNHMEPDHSSSIAIIKNRYPEMKIIGNSKTISMIEGFYGITGNEIEVKEGDTLDLGYHKLSFVFAPMVHWPEVMMTYDETEHVLFSADAFGCFGTIDGGIIDEDMNCDKYWPEMYRYYAAIVGKYGSPVQKILQKLSQHEFSMICSLHGPVWKKYISEAVTIYDKLSRYDGEEGVVIAYGSMYGNTEEMAEAIAYSLVNNGIKKVIMHNMSKSDPSQVLSDVFRYKGLIIGSPTYSNELFPEVKSLIDKIQTRDLKNRIYGYFGSFTWAGAAVKHLAVVGEKLKWDIVEPSVEMKQGINEDIIAKCYELGEAMAEKLKHS